MKVVDKDRLYSDLDKDKSLTDEERRDIYFSEVEEDEKYQQWIEEQR
jgi:hypothetical protein